MTWPSVIDLIAASVFVVFALVGLQGGTYEWLLMSVVAGALALAHHDW